MVPTPCPLLQWKVGKPVSHSLVSVVAYQFPVAARTITCSHELSSLHGARTASAVPVLEGRNVLRVPWAKIQLLAGYPPFWRLLRAYFSCSFRCWQNLVPQGCRTEVLFACWLSPEGHTLLLDSTVHPGSWSFPPSKSAPGWSPDTAPLHPS